MDLQLQELTRQGKNICEKCGTPKQMYYGPWCPRCDKPEIKNLKCLNLIKVLNHLEVIGHEGIKDRMWKKLCNSYNFGNDSYFTLFFPRDDEKIDYETQHWEDLQIIKKEFGITEEDILMEVSW